MAERKKKKTLWDDPSYGRSVRSYLEEIISENEAIKRARIGAEEYQSPSELAVAREIAGPAYSPGEEAWARHRLPLDQKRLADKQAELAASEAKKAATAAEFSEKAAELKVLQDRLRLEAGLNMGIIDTVPPDPAQFREREGTSPTTAPSDFNLERIMEDKGLSDLRRHFGEGAYGGAPVPVRSNQFTRPGTSWRIGGQRDDTLLPVDPMGINLSTGLPSAGIYRAPDQHILSDELSAIAEDKMMFARDARKEAAALAAPDEVEEIDVYREGEVPEEFTFKANEERATGPVKVQDLGKEEKGTPGSGKVVLPKTQPTNNFEDRLGLYNISIPAFTGRAKATIANRKTLQQRRDVLRAFQGMGPKDIVWADKMTTTEMLKLHDRKVSQMIAQAMFATNPQDRKQLSQLANKLGVNMKEWGLMQDRFEKSRPNLVRQKTALEVDALRIAGMIGPAAAVAWQNIAYDKEEFTLPDGSKEMRAVPTSDAVREARMEAFLATPMPTEARKAMLAEFEKLKKEDSGKTEMYVMPVMYKNTSFNKNMLKQLRIPFVERDGTGHFANPFQGEEGKPWLMLRNFRENILPLNLGEPLTRSYINRMINAPGEYRGFQQAITGENVPQMQLFANGQAVEGSTFSNNNTGLKAYYQSLARLQGSKGWPAMTVESAERGLQQFESAKNVRAGTIYKDLIEASNYAGNVADLTKTILDADDLHRVLGGQAGVKLAAINAVQLLGDWGSLLGIELDPETRLRVGQMSDGPATRAFNERISEVTDKTLREGKLVIEQKMREGIFSESLGNIMLEHNRLLRDEYETAKGVAGTNFQQEAIHARLLAISLATMGARMLSRNDRLLKDQYQAWRDETKIHDLLKSHDKARAIIVAMNRMASRMQANKAATAKAMLPPPPAVSYSAEANTWMPTNTGDEVVNRFMQGYKQRNLNQ